MGNLCAVFNAFGLAHFVFIAIVAVMAGTLIFLLRKFDTEKRKTIGVVLLTIAGLFVLLECVGKGVAGSSVGDCLPLAPSHIFLYLCIYQFVRGKENWIKFGYFISLPVMVLTTIFAPSYLAVGEAFGLASVSYFLTNACLIVYVVLTLMWSDVYLDKKDILNSSLNFGIIIAGVHIFNVFSRFVAISPVSNYWGTMGENYDLVVGAFSSLIPIPFVNMLPIVAIIVGIEFLMLLPFDMIKKKRDNIAQMEEIVALGNLKLQQERRKEGRKPSSQILVRSENKAMPKEQKNITQKSKTGFVSVDKEVKVHKDKQ